MLGIMGTFTGLGGWSMSIVFGAGAHEPACQQRFSNLFIGGFSSFSPSTGWGCSTSESKMAAQRPRGKKAAVDESGFCSWRRLTSR